MDLFSCGTWVVQLLNMNWIWPSKRQVARSHHADVRLLRLGDREYDINRDAFAFTFQIWPIRVLRLDLLSAQRKG